MTWDILSSENEITDFSGLGTGWQKKNFAVLDENGMRAVKVENVFWAQHFVARLRNLDTNRIEKLCLKTGTIAGKKVRIFALTKSLKNLCDKLILIDRCKHWMAAAAADQIGIFYGWVSKKSGMETEFNHPVLLKIPGYLLKGKEDIIEHLESISLPDLQELAYVIFEADYPKAA